MKNNLFEPTARLILKLLIVSLFCSVDVSYAGIREDAAASVTKLHQAGAYSIFPDDMASLDATLADAEQYYGLNALDAAKKLYLLTLQKANVIQLRINSANTDSFQPAESITSQPEIPVPIESQPGSDLFSAESTSSKLVGGTGQYTVASGDTIRLVAAKLGVTRQHLIKMNKLNSNSMLLIGQKLAYNNRKIVPKHLKNGIVVNIPDRTLYFFQNGKLIKSLPVALGTSTKNDKYVWQTPVGKFKVTAKQKDPTWYIPASIKTEMEEAGKEVKDTIPPGPQNPLGKYAIKTSIPGILIHSTSKPWSIYSFASHGCIRISPLEMESFFYEVKVNTPGEIIYQPVKLAVTESGKIFLEVHRDIYNKLENIEDEAKKQIEKLNLNANVDWKKFEVVTKQKSGIAEDISL